MGPFSPDSVRLVLVLVGLPARGKTYIGRKIARYLTWLGYNTRVFNIGDYRRQRLGSHHRQDFFDPNNVEGTRARNDMAQAALNDLSEWMKTGGEVAIYDATNTTRARRQHVMEFCEQHDMQAVFVESICEDPTIIDANVRETKLTSPDYTDMDPDEAVRDFRARIEHYARVYEPIEDEGFSYIKLIDVGRVIVVHRIDGFLPGRIVFFLLNLHLVRRPIWLTRHGESDYNQVGRIGGDSNLTPRGEMYARKLAEFVRGHSLRPPIVWCSTLKRTMQTLKHLPIQPVQWAALNEIDAGVCDGMTYHEIAETMPEEYAARQKDKLRYRYPRGESYQDVILRLEPVIIEAERQRTPVLIVAHQAVLRALYAYFMDMAPEDCLRKDIPLHTVIELTPGPYSFEEKQFPLM
jgi:broad specificity phosphatase PhoE/predicted kinase